MTRRFDLTGSGNVGVLFSNNDWFQTAYSFEDAAVPEPGALLLFGTAVAAASVCRRKHRQPPSGD